MSNTNFDLSIFNKEIEEKQISHILERLLKNTARIDKYIQNPKKDVAFLHTAEGIPVLFEKTITIIKGQKGSHKSRMSEILTVLGIKKNHIKREFLGFVHSKKKYHYAYVDTERNTKSQLSNAMRHIKGQAGYKPLDDIDNFDYTTIYNAQRAERVAWIKEYVCYLRRKTDKHLIVFLDVISDCVENFNNPNETLELIDFLNVMVNDNNCSFIAVIHENPYSEKARGHLGTELINKATTVMQVSRENEEGFKDIVKLKFEHTRNSERPEDIFSYFDADKRTLVLAGDETIADLKQTNRRKDKKETTSERNERWVELLEPVFHKQNELRHKELVYEIVNREIKAKNKPIKKESTAKAWISELTRESILSENDAGFYVLNLE